MANKSTFSPMFLCSFALVPCVLGLWTGFCRLSSVACILSSALCSLSSAFWLLTPDPWLLASTKDYVRKNKQNMQNKANFRKSQINISNVSKMNYDKMDTWSGGKNKANSNPIQTQYKANTNPIQSQYKANTKPIQTQTNPILSAICVAGQSKNRWFLWLLFRAGFVKSGHYRIDIVNP